GVAEIDPAEKLIDSYLKGFDRVVLGPERKVDAIESGFVTLEQKFKGEKEFKRVVKDPEIKVYRFVPGPQLEQAATARVDSLSAVNTLVLLNGSTSVQESKTENYFWLDRRLVKINIGNIDELRKFANRTGDVSLKLDLMTPWSGQELTLSLPDWSYKWEVKPDEIGSWISVDVKVPYRKLLSAGGITAAITQVRSPATQGLSTDSRRLGLAVRSLRRGSHP
ncbi:MAG: hypothetical protein GX589_02325, partial [Deltaproteobacteria bacterium]|nr:hypothetical protein [Deltaproteobacteria bacterium]